MIDGRSGAIEVLIAPDDRAYGAGGRLGRATRGSGRPQGLAIGAHGTTGALSFPEDDHP